MEHGVCDEATIERVCEMKSTMYRADKATLLCRTGDLSTRGLSDFEEDAANSDAERVDDDAAEYGISPARKRTTRPPSGRSAPSSEGASTPLKRTLVGPKTTIWIAHESRIDPTSGRPNDRCIVKYALPAARRRAPAPQRQRRGGVRSPASIGEHRTALTGAIELI